MTTAGCSTPAASGCKVFVDDQTSFVRWAGPATDATVGGNSSATVKYTAGTFCISGVLDAGPTGAGWGTLLHIGMSDVDEAMGTSNVVAPFNAPAVGIKQLQFNIDTPAISGVLLQVTQMQGAGCTTIPDCILSFTRTPALAGTGELAVPLTDFTEADADHPNAVLDPTLLTGLQFYVPSSPGTPRSHEFCIDHLAFTDAAGQEIRP